MFGVVTVGVLLAACTATPPGPDHSTPPVSSATSAGTTDAGIIVSALEPTPGVSVPGIQTGQIVRDDPTLPVDVRWPLVPGASALNDEVEGFARALERAFLHDASPSSTSPPELNLGWAVSLASGAIVGVQLDQYEFYGADGVSSAVTYYSDVTAGHVWRGRDLLTADGRMAAARDIAAALQRDGRTVLPELLNDPDQVASAVDALNFAPSGTLRFTLPEGALGPMSDGMSSVAVPAAVAAPWLSDAGRQVKAAATTATPYVGSGTATTSGPSGSTTTNASPTSNPSTSVPTSAPTTPTPSGGSVNCAVVRCVALTFDDGPGPSTGTLLDTLAAQHVHATFFVIGRNVQALSGLVKREAAEGHVVGNHTWSHRDLSRLGASEQSGEVSRTAEALKALGVSATLLRPPYGAFNATTRTLGLPLVLWDVDPADWRDRDAATVASRVLANTRPGSIVLLHDIHPSTVAAVPAIVAGLKAKGYTFVTVPQLVGTMRAGTAYFSRSSHR